MIGADIEITRGSFLQAPGGHVNLASVASAGEVTLGPDDLGAGPFNRLGKIEANQESVIDTSGEGGGSIFIRGGEFVVDNNSRIRAETLGDQNGVGIDVKVKSLSLTDGAQISTSTGDSSSGKGGELSIQANRVFLSGRKTEANGNFFPSGLFARANSTGDAGELKVKTGSLEVRDGAWIDADTFGKSNAGNVLVTADSIFLAADKTAGLTGIFAQSSSGNSGNAGDITITTGRLEMHGPTQIG